MRWRLLPERKSLGTGLNLRPDTERVTAQALRVGDVVMESFDHPVLITRQSLYPAVKREAQRFKLKVENELADGHSTDALVKNSQTFRELAVASQAASAARTKRKNTARRRVEVPNIRKSPDRDHHQDRDRGMGGGHADEGF
jgi:hypothetical protein